MILIYVTEKERDLLAEARDHARRLNPKSKAVVRNPRFHKGPADVEKCEAVIIGEKWPAVARDYRVAGIGVVVIAPKPLAVPDPAVTNDSVSSLPYGLTLVAPEDLNDLRTPARIAGDQAEQKETLTTIDDGAPVSETTPEKPKRKRNR
jgi:hypothetical protein